MIDILNIKLDTVYCFKWKQADRYFFNKFDHYDPISHVLSGKCVFGSNDKPATGSVNFNSEDFEELVTAIDMGNINNLDEVKEHYPELFV